MAPEKLKLGHRIAEARQTAGLTQAQLAERLDVATETVGRIERGTHMPSLMRLEQVARALGTELAALVRADYQPDRQERAISRVVAMLRGRQPEDAELVADLVTRIFQRWP